MKSTRSHSRQLLFGLLGFITLAISALLQQPPAQAEPTVLVCLSKSAYSYHSHTCQGLAKCTHEVKTVPLSTALQMGRKPCGYCY